MANARCNHCTGPNRGEWRLQTLSMKLSKNSILPKFFVRGPKGQIFIACDRDPDLKQSSKHKTISAHSLEFLGRFSENRKYRGSRWGAVAPEATH